MRHALVVAALVLWTQASRPAYFHSPLTLDQMTAKQAVVETDAGTFVIQLLPEAAPTFFEVVADPSITALSLRAFLQTTHATMSDLILTQDETDDIISYILTLRSE